MNDSISLPVATMGAAPPAGKITDALFELAKATVAYVGHDGHEFHTGVSLDRTTFTVAVIDADGTVRELNVGGPVSSSDPQEIVAFLERVRGAVLAVPLHPVLSKPAEPEKKTP